MRTQLILIFFFFFKEKTHEELGEIKGLLLIEKKIVLH